MIVKRREYQIKRLEKELKIGDSLPHKRQKMFKRSEMIHQLQSPRQPQNAINLTHKYFSTDQASKAERTQKQKRDEQRRMHRSLYNRPFHLLRQYLNRKQRLSFMPVFDSNPQKLDDISKAYNTLNQFRIKKSKKAITFNPINQIKNEPPVVHNKINKIDQDFISFNTSKNLYQMTQEELEESIKWKKHFLDMLNEKIKHSKTYGRERGFK